MDRDPPESTKIENGLGVITANTTIGQVKFSGSTDAKNYPVQSSLSSVEVFAKITWDLEK